MRYLDATLAEAKNDGIGVAIIEICGLVQSLFVVLFNSPEMVRLKLEAFDGLPLECATVDQHMVLSENERNPSLVDAECCEQQPEGTDDCANADDNDQQPSRCPVRRRGSGPDPR